MPQQGVLFRGDAKGYALGYFYANFAAGSFVTLCLVDERVLAQFPFQ